MKKKYLKWILVYIWMAVIFIFSNQPAQISNEKNKLVIYLFKMLGLDLNSMFGDLTNFIVRKAAHFTEYLILSLMLYNSLRESSARKKALYFTILYVFIYACTDEFHQIFVPGREGRFRDVVIDTSGGSFALALVYFYNKVFKK